jgi:hypothetical protein
MNEREEIRALLREMESVMDIDIFRARARRVLEVVNAVCGRTSDVERSLAICACCFLPGEVPRVLEEGDVIQRLLEDGLLLAETTFDGETVYDATVPGLNLVRRTMVEVHTANRTVAVT